MTSTREAPPPPTARALGFDKERLAETFLMERGLRPVARNHRCRYGEIDLIMLDLEILAFVEVRFRRSIRFGTPAESVGIRKQRRLTAAANHWLQRHPTSLACRFDVVAIVGQDRIEWIKHAFQPF